MIRQGVGLSLVFICLREGKWEQKILKSSYKAIPASQLASKSILSMTIINCGFFFFFKKVIDEWSKKRLTVKPTCQVWPDLTYCYPLNTAYRFTNCKHAHLYISISANSVTARLACELYIQSSISDMSLSKNFKEAGIYMCIPVKRAYIHMSIQCKYLAQLIFFPLCMISKCSRWPLQLNIKNKMLRLYNTKSCEQTHSVLTKLLVEKTPWSSIIINMLWKAG